MVSKSSRSIFALSIAFALCITSGQCGTRKVITWQNLEEFYCRGWYPSFPSGQGGAISKPSLINSTLAPLDSGVTGGGVWSGEKDGGFFDFYYNFALFEDFENIIEGNITINYYLITACFIGFFPCPDPNYNECRVYKNETEPIEWKTHTFHVDVTDAKICKFFRLLVPESVDCNPPIRILSILNDVSFSYEIDEEPIPDPTTEDPNLCNESCEYRAIDCHNYYSCIDFSYKSYYTCAEEDGLAFNPELGMCDRMEFVEGCAPPPKGNCEYRPDFNNCSNYYFCPDTFKEELCELRTCPRGLRYSVDEDTGIQHCTVPSKAKCAKYLNK